jgi:hypothetical protein
MENPIDYIQPLLKNLAVLYLTAVIVILVRSITTAGLDGFSLKLWFEENQGRFTIGAILIFCLSALMAMTDVSPLFASIGFDINASPVGLGVALAALLLIKPSKSDVDAKSGAAGRIQSDAQDIIKEAASIKQEGK